MKRLNDITFFYLMIPAIIFLVGWVKLWISLPIIILMGIFIVLRINKDVDKPINIKEYFKTNKKEILITLAITLLLVFMSGIGGFVFQNTDHLYRNGVFKELVNNEWPVYSEPGGNFSREVIMVYYFALWLPAAVVGKLLGFKAGLIALYLWCSIGVYITFKYLKVYYKKNYYMPILLFIGFSGLDIVSKFLYGNNIWELINSTTHLEWGAGYQFSSFTTQLFWVFNQAIPAWLLTLMILNEKDNKRLLVLISFGLIFSTLPTFGLMFIVLYKVFFDEKDKLSIKEIIDKIRDTISVENILIGIPLFIIFGTFVASNSTSGNITVGIPVYRIPGVLLAMTLEFLLYYYFVFKHCKEKNLILLSLTLLIICPFIKINGTGDFCMRASIPGLIVFFTLLLEAMAAMDKKSLEYKLLVIALILGAFTPLNEIKRTIANTRNDNNTSSVDLITSPHQDNFYGYKDESLFVKLFARK
jgi:hypothetical protein